MRSVTRSRNSRSWLTISIGTAKSVVSQRSSVLMLARSRWLVGSSSTSMSGSSGRAAAAISSSRCQPPERVPNGLSRCLLGRRRSRRTARRCASSRHPGRPASGHHPARRAPAVRRAPAGMSCGTWPTRSPRERITWPPLSSSAPVRHLSRVDLPAPFSPTSAVRASSNRNEHVLEDAARTVEERGLLHAEHGLTRRHDKSWGSGDEGAILGDDAPRLYHQLASPASGHGLCQAFGLDRHEVGRSAGCEAIVGEAEYAGAGVLSPSRRRAPARRSCRKLAR